MSDMCDELDFGRYVDPTFDAGFKALFCDKDNLDVLKILVNSFLPSDRKAAELEFAADREIPGFSVSDKVIRVDLRCRDENGRSFIVEMQKQPQNYFVKRCVEYTSRVYSTQLNMGESYDKLKPVYLIAFTKWDLREGVHGSDKSIVRYSFCDVEDGAFAFDDISIIFVRTDKAKPRYADCRDDGERCLHLLANMSKMEEMPEDWDATFGRLFYKAEIANFDKEKKDQYIRNMISERDYKNILETAREDGLLEGLEKGLEKGREEGLMKGLEEGKVLERVSIARTLLANGVSLEIVSKSTGISLEQLRDF